MYKIMIVEDDMGIADSIKTQLETWEYEAFYITDFKNVIEEFSAINPHLILIDISLPFFNGYHWCNEIRKISKVPIIFISSIADNMNIVMAMNMGGDDFIAKPFDLNVLMAKMQAILRRSYDFTNETNILQHREAFLNLEDNSLSYKNEKLILTKNEYRILYTLMKQKNKVVSREKLMEELWQTDSFVDENTLTVNINRLRKKLNEIGLENFISTKFGIGYIIN